MMRWQIQGAEQRFSEVLRAAAVGEPQFITRHGKEVAVVIAINGCRLLRGESSGFMAFLRADPIDDDNFEIARQSDLPRAEEWGRISPAAPPLPGRDRLTATRVRTA